jgi:uncharacterized protein involved in outer membrane biogenesis
MFRLLKWIFRLAFLAVVLIVALVLSKDAILRTLAERRIRAETGMDVKIGKFSVGLLSPVVTIKDFKLYNPPAFGGIPFVTIPELHVEYDRLALAQRKLHITLMRFNLSEFSVVKNEAGQTNIVSLMGRVGGKPPSGGGRSGGGSARADRFEFAGIDVLNLSLGKVRFIDLKFPHLSRELNLNLHDQILKNVKSESDLFGVLLLVWLRSGGSLSGLPMPSPPEIIPGPIPGVPPKP